MINLDEVLGVTPMMLAYRAERTQVLASNIANVDTPNYKARDLSFSTVMNSISDESKQPQLETQTLYRIPTQRSRDGNTVELQHEQAVFSENSMQYQQSLQFLKSRISGLKKAIDGR